MSTQIRKRNLETILNAEIEGILGNEGKRSDRKSSSDHRRAAAWLSLIFPECLSYGGSANLLREPIPEHDPIALVSIGE